MIGVSPDNVQAHEKFKAKHDLPMTLLADEDHAIAMAYGVWVEKNTFGVKRMGMARTTFLIDPAGNLVRVFEKVNPLGHGAAVLAQLERARK